MSKNNNKNGQQERPCSCKTSTEVTVNPWGMYTAGKKEKKNEPRGGKASWLQSQHGGRLRETLWGRYNQARRKSVKGTRPVGWGASTGSIIWDLRALNRGPMVYNVEP